MPEGCINNCLACGKCARAGFQILDSFEDSSPAAFTRREGYGIAMDIGTTSVVLALLDLSEGKMIARHSFMNPQRIFGADVITRISAANDGKLEELRRAIIDGVVAGVAALINSQSVRPEEITDIVVAGNTTMIYLLLGFPCQSLGVFPFKPAYDLAGGYTFENVFDSPDIRCPVRIIQWFTAFVGGDITAGLLSTITAAPNSFLLIDLGTNGEMALYRNNELTITSTAAGPAFEGAGHSGGASGVLDSLAGLIRDGFVDETGRLADNAPPVFTQKEIRELQLAKSAVRSGLEILLKTADMDYDALDAVYLAGGIGQAMHVDSAVAVGLLPQPLRARVHAVGNASLSGAIRLLLAPERIEDARALLSGVQEINLSAHPDFNDYFMEYMCLY